MNRLLIVGAGGFGREVLCWLLDIPEEERDWEIAGFLDTNPLALKGYTCSYPILGNPLNFDLQEDDRLVCAIGDPKTKLRLCGALKERGGEFFTLVHKTAVIGMRCKIGEGSVVCPGAIITSDVNIGKFVTVNVHASVGHDSMIGDGSTLSGHADVTGFVKIGRGVFLGSHAAVIPKAQVGDFAVVGAGSVVVRRVKPNITVMGVPARQLV